MKTYEGVHLYTHVFFTSTLIGGEGQLHVLAALPPEKEPPVAIE
jgi:hypothetical protein